MIDEALIKFIRENNIEHHFNKKTSELVTFRIGGNADLVVYPEDVNQLCEILIRQKGRKRVLVGFGSNCYFKDAAYDGIVIVTRKICGARVDGNKIIAECGSSMHKLCKLAVEHSLTGMEFAYGIPGTIGGAIVMNASAFDKDISGLVNNSLILDVEKEEIKKLVNCEHLFGIKSSLFRNRDVCLLKSELLLKSGKKDEISAQMNKNFEKRTFTQPLDMPNAGSTFVRPDHGYASQMIDLCGLKGMRVGGACVSEKHAGFIVNMGGATSYDVMKLIGIIKEKVFEKFNIELKEEIILVE